MDLQCCDVYATNENGNFENNMDDKEKNYLVCTDNPGNEFLKKQNVLIPTSYLVWKLTSYCPLWLCYSKKQIDFSFSCICPVIDPMGGGGGGGTPDFK